MLCIAAPVFDVHRAVVGALGMTVLTLHCSRQTPLSQYANPVLDAAKAATEILGADMSQTQELEIVEVRP
jgi:DNA-binding IclR family transcriptional regulator